MARQYKQYEIDFLLDFLKTHSYRETQEVFNEKFNAEISVNAVKYMCNTRGVYAFNKKKKAPFEVINTSKPVGSEYIDPDGYIYLKVAEPNKWRLKHHWNWEKFNQPIKPDETLFFLDRNKQNCDINNLAVMPKKYIGCFNKYFANSGTFTQETFASAMLVCGFYIKSKEIKRKRVKEHPMRPAHVIEAIRQGNLARWRKK